MDEFGGRTSLMGGSSFSEVIFFKWSVLEIHFKTEKKIRLRRANFRVDEFGGRTCLVGDDCIIKSAARRAAIFYVLDFLLVFFYVLGFLLVV